MMDPLAGSAWNRPETVAGFAQSSPNPVLMQFAQDELCQTGASHAIDLGCGAGRNAVPLAGLGWHVLGVDLSWPMLAAAAERAHEAPRAAHLRLALAPMGALPVRGHCVDLIVAHGIWNLARSGAEFRLAVAEAARVAKPGAGLFVFTFSRHTLPPDAKPVEGEAFVFTQFSGQPQCFLTEDQLISELGAAAFTGDPGVPLRELNRPAPGMLPGSGPVIFEGGFRYRA